MDTSEPKSKPAPSYHGPERRSPDHYELRLQNLEEKIDHLTDNVAGLVTAWRTANGLVRFVKWSTGFVLALAALWAFFIDGKWH